MTKRFDEVDRTSSRERLLSDEPTVDLVHKAQAGNRHAVDALLERCLPKLKRWAHGRLPADARPALDTNDLIQETVIHLLRNLATFEPRHVGSMQAYLRQAVINRIRDEVRRLGRKGTQEALPDDLASKAISPLEAAIINESYERYRNALTTLRSRDRELIVARIESLWTVAETVQHLGFPSAAAAQMAYLRALRRLKQRLEADS
jgi:RNA polymerase sigma-70 factor (ECF subfamily)